MKKKVMIQISKLKGNKKQAKYDQKVITVLKIKQKHGLKTASCSSLSDVISA